MSAALPDASHLRSIECRTRLCRIETEHADSEQSLSFMQKAFMSVERQVWNGAFVSVRGEPSVNGKISTVTYLAREGVDLPMEELFAPGDEDAQALQ
ncbi:hypothetical protein LXT21_20105 [Myxococcus sp. K38C18041901]|uniref:hypothetical protein n=1 Tax=Myxococcus guangdongensis TaxID=2906760 RepID=UPI0020A7A4D6|nr:hypothetical protein [Myxococcus guangdongensis]MCP3061089.1 hypothetical protein [Myxococcus guangdongensis]